MLILPTCIATVKDALFVDLMDAGPRHLVAVSDSHSVDSQVELPTRALPVNPTIPILLPWIVMLIDPVPFRFDDLATLITGISAENASVKRYTPILCPTVMDIDPLPPKLPPDRHRIEVSDSHNVG